MTLGLPLTAKENAARITTLIGPLAQAARGRRVFLVDGDRTLSLDDTSRSFLRQAGLDPMDIKRRFQQDGYCFGSFRFHAEVHLNLGEGAFAHWCPLIAREAVLHEGAIDFLRQASANAAVFVVTAGIPRIWYHVLEKHHLEGIEVIGGIDPRAPYVFGRREKGDVCRLFLAAGANVIGVGDSDVDSEMLQLAHQAVVVVNQHRNADLLPHLAHHPFVWQVVPRGVPHNGIPKLDFAAVAAIAHGYDAKIAEAPLCP